MARQERPNATGSITNAMAHADANHSAELGACGLGWGTGRSDLVHLSLENACKDVQPSAHLPVDYVSPDHYHQRYEVVP